MLKLTPFTKIQFFLFIVINCFFFNWVNAQEECLVDTTPPTAVCKSSLKIDVNDYTIIHKISASTLNRRSFDNCTNPEKLRFAFSTNLADSIFIIPIISGHRIRQYPLPVWIFDEKGNFTTCTTNLSVTYKYPCSSDL